MRDDKTLVSSIGRLGKKEMDLKRMGLIDKPNYEWKRSRNEFTVNSIISERNDGIKFIVKRGKHKKEVS